MILCRVVGTVVASEKHAALHARRLMMVQPIDAAGAPSATGFVAVDEQMSAGPGDRVLVLKEGSGARQLLGEGLPIRSVIVGIVDEVGA